MLKVCIKAFLQQPCVMAQKQQSQIVHNRLYGNHSLQCSILQVIGLIFSRQELKANHIQLSMQLTKMAVCMRQVLLLDQLPKIQVIRPLHRQDKQMVLLPNSVELLQVSLQAWCHSHLQKQDCTALIPIFDLMLV